MKLKKIASLMLAGVMAVSMLTACNTTSNDNDDNQDDDIVIPVDDSFAVDINNELNTAQKNTLTITADSDLEALLNKVADKFDDHSLQITKGTVVTAFVLDTDSTVPQDARHLMGLKDDASLTTTNGNGSRTPDGYLRYNNSATNDWAWKYFAKNDSVETTLDFIVVDGGQTEEGLAHEVAKKLGELMTENRMPGEARVYLKTQNCTKRQEKDIKGFYHRQYKEVIA